MKKVLVVDDEKPIQQILKFNLKKSGYDVYVAGNGAEGLEMAREIMPDLVILDIMMPKMSGFEVCQALHTDEKTRNIPVIFLSAKGQAYDKEKGTEYGACVYLTKPFSPKVVIEHINKLLGE